MQELLLNFSDLPYNGPMPGGRPTDKKASSLGARIAEARNVAGLSQNELATKIGVKQYTIAYWERKSAALKGDQLVLLADCLNVTTDYLLGRENKKRGQGPTGKARKLFEEISKLPRHQQQHILSTTEDMLIAQKVKKAS